MVAEWRADGRADHSATIVGAAPYGLMTAALTVFSLPIRGTYDEK
jgi:hypothetical protein